MAFDMSAFQNAAAAGEVKEKASGASVQHTTTVLPAGVPDLCQAIVDAYQFEPDLARVKAAGTRLDGRPIMAAAFKSGSRNVAIYTAKKAGDAGKVTWVNCDPLN
jgi:hypothetical protein